jgi:hypothetical protein
MLNNFNITNFLRGKTMDIQLIFVLQFVLSLLVAGLLARWYAAPWLADKPLEAALMVLLLPHAFRHVGLAFIVPALNQPGMPVDFAVAAAYGDLLSGILALVALIALKGRWAMAIPLVWVFNIVGAVDLANALRQDAAILHMGATWFIPTFLVPVLLVTHFMVFARLIKNAKGPQFLSAGESTQH